MVVTAGRRSRPWARAALGIGIASALIGTVAFTTAGAASRRAATDKVTLSATAADAAPFAFISPTWEITPDPLVAGEPGHIRATLLNLGPNDATGLVVNVIDEPFAELSILAVRTDLGPCLALVTCGVGDIPVGQSRTIDFDVLMPEVFLWSMSVFFSSPDIDIEGNPRSIGGSSTGPSLFAQVQIDPAYVSPGDGAVLHAPVTNSSTFDASHVVVSIARAQFANFSKPFVTDDNGTRLAIPCPPNNDNTALVCALGTIAAGTTIHITLPFKVTRDATVGTQIVLRANVQFGTAGNAGTFTTNANVVRNRVDLETRVLLHQTPAVVGTTYPVFLSVTNHGPTIARDTHINGKIPAVLGTPTTVDDRCTIKGQHVDCAAGDLDPNTEVQFQIDFTPTVKAARKSPIELTFVASSAVGEVRPDPTSNRNTIELDVEPA